MDWPNGDEGLTLIEIVIVIAVIAVLAAVSIWPYLRARDASRESAALQVLRGLRSAEVQAKTKLGHYVGLDELAKMGSSPVTQGGAEHASDYTFTSSAGTDHYTIIAIPPRQEMVTYTLVESGDILPAP
jgi:prepilin-type N-terminal cleavage/methylation domain-containing protein